MLESNYNEIKLNQRCPHCNGELMQLSSVDPTSFDFQTKTKIVCINCHRELQRSDLKVTEPIEEKNKGIELPKGGMMGWICPKCGKGLSPFVGVCPCSISTEATWTTNSTSTVKIRDTGNCSLSDLEHNLEKGLYTYKNGF